MGEEREGRRGREGEKVRWLLLSVDELTMFGYGSCLRYVPKGKGMDAGRNSEPNATR